MAGSGNERNKWRVRSSLVYTTRRGPYRPTVIVRRENDNGRSENQSSLLKFLETHRIQDRFFRDPAVNRRGLVARPFT